MTTREEVLKEIEKKKLEYLAKGKTEEDFWTYHFGNFSACFSDNYMWAGYKVGVCGNKDTHDENESPLMKSQTTKEFFDTLERLMAEEHIDLEDLRKGNRNSNLEIMLTNKKLFLVYVRLREMGYYHYPDLTG